MGALRRYELEKKIKERRDRNTRRVRRKNIGEIEAVVRGRGRGQGTDIGDDQDQRARTLRMNVRGEGRGRKGKRRKKRRKENIEWRTSSRCSYLTSIVKFIVS